MVESKSQASVSAESIDPKSIVAQTEKAHHLPDDLSKRVREQLRFASTLAKHHDNDQWATLVSEALESLEGATVETPPETVVDRVESKLEPIGEVARTYTIHYIGHAHIDMNWLWDYPETVHTTYRAFDTMFDIMDEFPEFTYTQSQASTYSMMSDHAPEFIDEIGERIDDGQWEVAANTWVQGDKNISSGESQARHLLYTDRFVDSELDTDSNSVDFEPDTFGHPRTVPKILQNAGVDYYYFGRASGELQPDNDHGPFWDVPRLFWWESFDGSRVLAFNGGKLWYNGHIDPAEATEVLDFEAETDLREFMNLYGVGNHGGGPTRGDIETIHRMNDWPIFPATVPSSLESYFEAVESAGTEELPVVRDELNFTFRGCYSSQSEAKQYNRELEAYLPTVEALSVIATQETDFEYPDERLTEAWKHVLFNQFHDILPGAGIPETYDHALGKYQEAKATADLVQDRALDSLIDQGGLYQEDADSAEYETDGVQLLVFNPTGRTRTSHIRPLVYDYPETWTPENFMALDTDGTQIPVQTTETIDDVREKIDNGEYRHNQLPDPSRLMHDSDFGPHFARVALTVPDIPPYGYKIITLQHATQETEGSDQVSVEYDKNTVTLENERYRLQGSPGSGGLVSLYDKKTERELVPDGDIFGLLTVEEEAPNDMSAWVRDHVRREDVLDDGWTLDIVESGPNVVSVRWERQYRDSTLRVKMGLPAGTDEIEFEFDITWREIGNSDRGTPTLRVHFPVVAEDPTFSYDIPFGFEERVADDKDVPANRWADITDAASGAGVTVANDTTHGHSAVDTTLSLTLLRSSYSPDPTPEVGHHQITCTVRPHGDDWSPADAAAFGETAASDPIVEQLMPGSQDSTFASERSFLNIDTEQVRIASVKQSETGDKIIVRLEETAGESTTATLSTAWPLGDVVETDILEQSETEELLSTTDGGISLELSPLDIRTLKLTPEGE